jgi:hypothetical protein
MCLCSVDIAVVIIFVMVLKKQAFLAFFTCLTDLIVITMGGVFEPLFQNGRTASAAAFLYLLLSVGITFLAALFVPYVAVHYVLCLLSPGCSCLF